MESRIHDNCPHLNRDRFHRRCIEFPTIQHSSRHSELSCSILRQFLLRLGTDRHPQQGHG